MYNPFALAPWKYIVFKDQQSGASEECLKVQPTEMLGPVKNGAILAGAGRSHGASREAIGGDAVRTL
jgi:hypothetical protein